ncbi:MAG: Na/Pi symporter [Nitriliruptoraceae bacterium]
MTDVPWFELASGMLGGLALFLLGIQQLTRALQNVASGRLRTLLLAFSRTSPRGAASGALTTAVIQSSTATIVLLVGFVAAGAMTLRQAMPVVLGANVGTTLTMQIIAFDVTAFALIMIAAGFVGSTWRRFPQLNSSARSVLALGLMFFGMGVMATAVAPLRDHPVLSTLLTGRSTIIGALVIGAVITAVVQSSSAMGGLLIVLAAQGLVDLETGIAAMLGASVGTCITPIIAGLGTSRAGLRVAVGHLVVNVVGVGLWIWWIPQLAELSVAVVAAATGGPSAATDVPRQLANAYTMIKLANLVVLLGAAGWMAKLLERTIGDDDRDEGISLLDDDVLTTPDVALALARRETSRLADEVTSIVADAIPTVLNGGLVDLDELAARDHRVDAIYERLVQYLGDVGRTELSDDQGDELLAILAMANDLESIGDVVETNLVGIGRRRLTEGIVPSQPTTHVVIDLHARVLAALAALRDAMDVDDNETGLTEVLAELTRIDQASRRAFIHLARRLRADEPNRIRAFEREMEIVGQLQRIAALTGRLAKTLRTE